MAEITNISWADATLNFWIGCTKVSTGDHGACEYCYAETWANRFPQTQGRWGVGAPRLQTQHALSKAKAIVRKGQKEGRRQFVFSNSLGDIFDKEVPIEWLAQAFEVAAATPENIYLFLTKRAPLIEKRAREALAYAGMKELPANIAFGITIVTQAEANRDVPHLLRAKAALRPAFVFVSMEPLRGPVNLTFLDISNGGAPTWIDALRGWSPLGQRMAIDWVITGGESGAKARPSDPAWFRSLRDQCAAAGVAFHFKQWGEWQPLAGRAANDILRDGTERYGWINSEAVWRVGKKADPCTLDGVLHRARPAMAEAA